MPNWQDPGVIAYCAFVYDQITIFVLSLFVNHILTTLQVEWSLITRRRRFGLVLLPYLFGRYGLLCTLLAFVLTSGPIVPVRACDVFFKTITFFGSAASVCSTLNLGMRSYIIWKDMSMAVVWAMRIGSFLHLSLSVLQTFLSVTFVWDPVSKACVVVKSSNITMFVFYLYTIILEFTVLILTVCGLWKKAALDTRIGLTLRDQCLWYCIGSFVCTIPAVIFPILNLNAVMNVISSMPATTACVMMSSYAVLSLQPDEGHTITTTDSSALPSTFPRTGVLGGIRTVHDGVLTTNIALESRADSSAEPVFRAHVSKIGSEVSTSSNSPV